jgi:hypothetical protein
VLTEISNGFMAKRIETVSSLSAVVDNLLHYLLPQIGYLNCAWVAETWHLHSQLEF